MKSKIEKYIAVFATTIVLVVHAASVSADMYGVNAAGELFRIDVATGAGTIVGNLPISGDSDCCVGYNEIAYDESTNTAWAQERDGNFRAQPFNIEDASTAGLPVANGASWHAWEFIGPTLYAAGFAGVVSNGFATMDPAVGVASVSIITDGTWGEVLASDVFTGIAYSGVTLYGITNGTSTGESSLYTIDLATGSLTLVGASGIRAGSLEFGNDGNLYAGGVAGNAGGLFQINTVTGAAALIGDTGFSGGGGISGLMRTGQIAPSTAVPTISAWAVTVLTVLLGLLVFANRRRLF